jgi:hypothetical protein
MNFCVFAKLIRISTSFEKLLEMLLVLVDLKIIATHVSLIKPT